MRAPRATQRGAISNRTKQNRRFFTDSQILFRILVYRCYYAERCRGAASLWRILDAGIRRSRCGPRRGGDGFV